MLATDYDKTKLEHLPKISIEVIPHNDQRYETCGDWIYGSEGLKIRISETNPKYEFLVAVHELIEALLCNFKDIKEQDVTDFDMDFERMRDHSPRIVGDDEPGDNENAPYHHEHQMASRVERWIGDSIGIDWNEYEKIINNLRKF